MILFKIYHRYELHTVVVIKFFPEYVKCEINYPFP